MPDWRYGLNIKTKGVGAEQPFKGRAGNEIRLKLLYIHRVCICGLGRIDNECRAEFTTSFADNFQIQKISAYPIAVCAFNVS